MSMEPSQKKKHVAFEVTGRGSTRPASTLPLLQNRQSGVSCCSRVSRQPQHHTRHWNQMWSSSNDQKKWWTQKWRRRKINQKWLNRKKNKNTEEEKNYGETKKNDGRPVYNQRFGNIQEFITHSAWKPSSWSRVFCLEKSWATSDGEVLRAWSWM